MSLKTEILHTKSLIQNALSNINDALISKGASQALSLYDVGNKISTIQSGSDSSQVNDPIYFEKIKSLISAFRDVEMDSIYLYCPDCTNLQDTFRDSRIREIYINLSSESKLESLQRCFYNDIAGNVTEKITIDGDLSKLKNYNNCFSWLPKISEVNCTFDFTSATNVEGIFATNLNVTGIRFKANTLSKSLNVSKVITNEVEFYTTLFDCLKQVDTTQTLTLNTNAHYTQAQLDSATSKGWTVVGGVLSNE